MVHFVPQRLRAARRHAGIKPELLALQLGRSVHSISAWERGASTPSAVMLARIANVLGIAPGDLYAEEDQR